MDGVASGGWIKLVKITSIKWIKLVKISPRQLDQARENEWIKLVKNDIRQRRQAHDVGGLTQLRQSCRRYPDGK